MSAVEYGVCPVCNGSGRVAAGDHKYKSVMASYDHLTDTLSCTNCGGQTMYGRPTGKVPLRATGEPCVHEYTGRNAGRCYTIYSCNHCSFRFDIDSSD